MSRMDSATTESGGAATNPGQSSRGIVRCLRRGGRERSGRCNRLSAPRPVYTLHSILLHLDARGRYTATAEKHGESIRGDAVPCPGRVLRDYCDLDLPDWPNAYWGPNLDRLRHVESQYDPSNVFVHVQSVPLPPQPSPSRIRWRPTFFSWITNTLGAVSANDVERHVLNLHPQEPIGPDCSQSARTGPHPAESGTSAPQSR
jgi:hypothetical protein